MSALERIVDLQGRHKRPASPGDHIYEVNAGRSGIIEKIDSTQISGIARSAGAPMDKSAGIDLLVRVGDKVVAGAPLYLIHGSVDNDVRIAVERSESDTGISTR